MKKSILILALLCLSNIGMTQFNDTIFYKSGMEKIVEITEYTDALIKFKTVNSKDNTVNSQVNTFVVLHYVMYDEEGILQYDSRSNETASNQTMQGLNKYPFQNINYLLTRFSCPYYHLVESTIIVLETKCNIQSAQEQPI
jgi:hypothetical protein